MEAAGFQVLLAREDRHPGPGWLQRGTWKNWHEKNGETQEKPWKNQEKWWFHMVSYGFMGDSIGDIMGISLTNLTLVDIYVD